jgi:rubrerythrin
MANLLSCLSELEYNTASLYSRLSEKTEIPIAKSLLLAIAQDSSKHSALLKGVGDSISATDTKTKDCERNLGQIWLNVTTLLNEANSQKEAKLPSKALYKQLKKLESGLGEEYYIFVQMQTLQLLSKMINKTYNISTESIKGIFESILKDEDHHLEVLATLLELNEPKTKEYDLEAIVNHEPSDRWIHYPPNNI